MMRLLCVALCLCFGSLSTQAWAEDTYELEQKIKRMEKRLKKLEQEKVEPKSDSGFSLNKENKDLFGPPPKKGIYKNIPRSSGSSADSSFSTATGLSRAFNPAVSVNGLFLGRNRFEGNNDQTKENSTGMEIQEMELQFTANVDSYLRANFRISFEDDEVEIEESFVDVLLMDRLALRAGQFYTSFGKHNLLHTHQFPFIDAPIVNQEIFGDEALLEIGLGTSYLVPFPWYSEAMFQFLEGKNENLFDGPLNNDFAYLFHLKNLWDLNEDTTAEVGGSYVFGRNRSGASRGTGNANTNVVGADFTVKWNPARRARYNTLIWQTEYIAAFQETGINTITGLANGNNNRGGMYSFLQYQFMERWWVQGRYDYFGFHQVPAMNDKNRYTALLAFVPSEFSAIRLQYSYLTEQVTEEHLVMLQLNFSMGSHPAHRY